MTERGGAVERGDAVEGGGVAEEGALAEEGAVAEPPGLVDLASARLGGRVLLANDEFFGPKESLLKPEPPVFIEGKYTDRGKWMDGWETRRRREPGHDWCILRLGVPGVLRRIVVDTAHFRGNHPEACSLEACEVRGDPGAEELASLDGWREVVPLTSLRGDARNEVAVRDRGRCTHLRLNIHPDGGVARLRAYGEARPDWDALRAPGEPVDLAAAEHGGSVLACSDAFFGRPLNLIMPGPAANMGDGWETRRRRGPGHDWVILRLGHRGRIRRVEVDTSHFKGNYPESCRLEGCDAPDLPLSDPPGDETAWRDILPRTKLGPDARHLFEEELASVGPVTHVRFHIYPDGGVARLRLYGRPVEAGDGEAAETEEELPSEGGGGEKASSASGGEAG